LRLCQRRWKVSGAYGTARLAGLFDLMSGTSGGLLADRG